MNQPFVFRGVSTLEFYSSNLELIVVRRFFGLRYCRKQVTGDRSSGLRLNYSYESSAEWEYAIFLILHKFRNLTILGENQRLVFLCFSIKPAPILLSSHDRGTQNAVRRCWWYYLHGLDFFAIGRCGFGWDFTALVLADFFLELGRGYVEYPVDMYIICLYSIYNQMFKNCIGFGRDDDGCL